MLGQCSHVFAIWIVSECRSQICSQCVYKPSAAGSNFELQLAKSSCSHKGSEKSHDGGNQRCLTNKAVTTLLKPCKRLVAWTGPASHAHGSREPPVVLTGDFHLTYGGLTIHLVCYRQKFFASEKFGCLHPHAPADVASQKSHHTNPQYDTTNEHCALTRPKWQCLPSSGRTGLSAAQPERFNTAQG